MSAARDEQCPPRGAWESSAPDFHGVKGSGPSFGAITRGINPPPPADSLPRSPPPPPSSPPPPPRPRRPTRTLSSAAISRVSARSRNFLPPPESPLPPPRHTGGTALPRRHRPPPHRSPALCQVLAEAEHTAFGEGLSPEWFRSALGVEIPIPTGACLKQTRRNAPPQPPLTRNSIFWLF